METQTEPFAPAAPAAPVRDVQCLDDKLGLWLRIAQKRFIEQINRRFSRFKVNHLDFLVMTLVERNPGCRLMLLSQNLRLQPPNVAKVIDDLVGRSLIAKTADLVDRRANHLSLTQGGAALLVDLRREHDQLSGEIMRSVDPDAREQVLPIIRDLIKGMRPAPARPATQLESWP